MWRLLTLEGVAAHSSSRLYGTYAQQIRVLRSYHSSSSRLFSITGLPDLPTPNSGSIGDAQSLPLPSIEPTNYPSPPSSMPPLTPEDAGIESRPRGGSGAGNSDAPDAQPNSRTGEPDTPGGNQPLTQPLPKRVGKGVEHGLGIPDAPKPRLEGAEDINKGGGPSYPSDTPAPPSGKPITSPNQPTEQRTRVEEEARQLRKEHEHAQREAEQRVRPAGPPSSRAREGALPPPPNMNLGQRPPIGWHPKGQPSDHPLSIWDKLKRWLRR